MRYGYARVSTLEQQTRVQLDALKAASVDQIFEEKRSGKSLRRPELQKLLALLRPGDEIIVLKFDRIARSLIDLLSLVERIDSAGAQLRSLTEHLDTSSPAGRFIFQILGAFAEFERCIIVERTIAGLEAARARGVRFGRARHLSEKQHVEMMALWNSGKFTKTALASRYGCHISSIKREITRAKENANPTMF
jgi:DNA invertase Pin-like site-specific DNA recombinase